LRFLDTKNVPLILVYRDMDAVPDASRYDVMLTPQFYIIKREELPLKYPFQAKKLAPSILEELTGEEHDTYEAFQEGEAWVFVAYDLQALADFLTSKGGSIDQVRHIYFAEQAKDKLTSPVSLSEREALTLVNDTVTVVPKRLLGSTEDFIPFSDAFRPKKSFSISRSHSSFLDTKLTVILATLLVLLGLTYFAEGYRYRKAVSDSEKKLETLLDANPSLRGAYARASIHKKYATINTAQRRIRDRIKDVSRLTGKDTKLAALFIDAKGYRMTLDIPRDTKTVASLKALAKTGGLEHVKIGSGKLETWGAFK